MGSTPVSRTLSRGKPQWAFALLSGTILAGVPVSAMAQDGGAATSMAQPAPQVAPGEVIQTISVQGAQRLEPDTILTYIRLRPGQVYTQIDADQALKDLYATELFANATIRNDNGNVIIEVTENPVINRIILEGNKRLKEDKIAPEIKLAPRQIFTRSKVRADVARIIELYKRQGRFAATVEPKTVQLSQNRVDLVFEINEGPKSKVRQINIIGNDVFSDGKLKGEMVTKEARLKNFLSGNTSYDPDRLAFDQQKLREFYLTEGYVDFRVVSAVAELTPDKQDFIITYVVEEGERYKFGDVKVQSNLRDFDSDTMTSQLKIEQDAWYNAKTIEDISEQLTELAGTFGYAFADVRPQFTRNQDKRTMDVTLVLSEAPRVYVERVDVNGNTLTQDKVIRREMRIAEGDAFNSLAVKRSTNRINSLGYFQEQFEIEQKETNDPDRIILEANVEEQPTGQLQLSAGFSSIESFLLAASIQQKNFRGRGQTVGAGVQWSRYSRSANLSFVEPYVFDRNISLGADIYRRDLNSFNYIGSSRNNTFEQTTTGGSLRVGVPLSEYLSLVGSYTLNFDDISLDQNTYFADFDGDGVRTCEPLLAGRYLCDVIGKRTSSILGANFIYDTLNSRYRPSRGEQVTFGVDFAGLGGDVKYVKARASAKKFWQVLGNFVFSLSAEGGYIKGLSDRGGAGVDDVRLNDRFFLGEPQIRGFDIRGIGPRVLRQPLIDDPDSTDPTKFIAVTDRQRISDDALGGNAYYLARAELQIPLGSGAADLGLRPSIFMDVGALFNVTTPLLNSSPFPDGIDIPIRNADGQALYTQINNATLVTPPGGGTPVCTPGTAPGSITTVTNPINPNPPACLASANNDPLVSNIAPFQEVFLGDSPAPRISVGIGVDWNSPFGPFRIDFAYALRKQPGDDTKLFSFNVGTQF
ncbi:outer membrane protein assembly factor BamA [Erythrobacter sp. SDW2]|uniref:outer membrane protein assembly factor BamA n=1 Tax=Erythrobacter sp. SDW2 TaxID=2907154 RepID=UPI001F19655E|nr:outer membrane protein assembly factor BamA [Erythrobacter sp. SDW2]UIP06113.1 outer membrane protein assembly factor BamA [Erythrobacter sp. SDW2]